MTKKSFIDSVKVGEPCSEKWENMRGTESVRFCSHCAKDVKNLSAITRKEALCLVRSSHGNICIRYIKNPVTEQPIFGGQLLQITRRSPALAAGLVTASMALSTMSYAQSEPPIPNPNVPVVEAPAVEESNEEPETASDPTLGSIEGIILDQSGVPVADVTLMLVQAGEGDDFEYETTDADGRYRFDELKADTYLLRISSSTGVMKKAMRGIKLGEGQKLFQNIYVKVVKSEDGEGGSGWGEGGAMVYLPYDLPLNKAVADSDIAEVRRLLAEGAKVNGKDKNYSDISPLFLAVENGKIEMVRLLLDHGAKVNAEDETERTPLMFLDSDATPELVEMLLNAGAKINAHDKAGSSVLLAVVGSVNADVLEALIKGGADINDADEEDVTPLMKAAEENDIEFVKILVLAGAKVDERDKSGESAWDKTSKTEIEEFLEVHGATVDYSTVEVLATEPPSDEDPAEEAEPQAKPLLR